MDRRIGYESVRRKATRDEFAMLSLSIDRI